MLKKNIIFINLLLIIYGLSQILAYFVAGNLLLEWIISLMPYFIILNVIIISCLLLLRVFSFPLVLICIVTMLMIIRIVDFTKIKPQAGTENRAIKVLFFNKLNDNTNYPQIHLKIKEINPDIIGMAELEEKDKDEIAILKEYPYSYIKDTQDNASLALFSKYEFFIKNPSLFSHLIDSIITIDGKKYNIFVFHPVPPATFKNMEERNDEIKKLSAYVDSLQNTNVIIMGDFNVTPWSPIYIKYLSQLQSIKNIAKGNGMHITYHSGMFQIPIDYIFVSSKFRVESFENEYMPGSDHNLIWAIIKI